MPQTASKYLYRAFGLNIQSEVKIEPFSPSAGGEFQVIVRKGKVPLELTAPVNRGVLYQSAGNEFLLRINDVAGFYVRNGNEITVEPFGGTADSEISAFLNGTVFGALLHQRRMLPIHASTVIYKGACIVFAGVSGAGKSTLAAALVSRGGTLVADDISVIDFRDHKPFVYPSYPAMKLWEDSLKHIAQDDRKRGNDLPDEVYENKEGTSLRKLTPVRPGLLKYYKPAPLFRDDEAEVDRIIILGSHNKTDYSLREIKGVEKFLTLKKHTYLFRGIPKTNLQESHFVLAGKLAALLPVHMLTRPAEWSAIDKMVSVIDNAIGDGNDGRK